AAGRCHGFLLAARGDTAFDLDPTSRLLLATLGDILSVLFERAIAYDELVSRNRLETEFIALASHEIRSPAAAVCGIATALLMQADSNAFDHIVSNLVANALRYGRKSIAVSASVQDRHFRLAVEDRGPGVPQELEPALFDRFTRGDNGGESGTGLGLSIARAYAHAHGGELVYGSAKPHGARFELVIPISSERGVVGPQHGLDS